MLRFAGGRLRDQREFVFWATITDCTNFEHASDRLRADRDLVWELLRNISLDKARIVLSSSLLSAANEDLAMRMLFQCKQIYEAMACWVLWCIGNNFFWLFVCLVGVGVCSIFLGPNSAPLVIFFFSKLSEFTWVLVFSMVALAGSGFYLFLKKLLAARAISMAATIPPRSRLKKMPRQQQREILINYLRENPEKYERVVTNGLRGDREVAKAVSTASRGSLAHFGAGSRWRDDREIVLDVLSKPNRWDIEAEGSEFSHASRRLRGDREVALAGVRHDSRAFRDALAPATDDEEVVLSALYVTNAGPHAWQSQRSWPFCTRRPARVVVSRILDLDTDTAIAENAFDLEYVSSTRIKNDVNFGMACLRSSWSSVGLTFPLLGDALKSNRDFVSYAIRREPFVLRYAAPSICDDFDLVMTAVGHKMARADYSGFIAGPVLKYASDRLRRDRTLVKTALRNNFRSWDYVGVELQVDPEMKELARQLGADRDRDRGRV